MGRVKGNVVVVGITDSPRTSSATSSTSSCRRWATRSRRASRSAWSSRQGRLGAVRAGDGQGGGGERPALRLARDHQRGPYEEGWMIQVEVSDFKELETLLDAAAVPEVHPGRVGVAEPLPVRPPRARPRRASRAWSTHVRYHPHARGRVREMLEVVGASSLDDLFRSIPEPLRLKRPLEVPPALDEIALFAEMRRLAAKNQTEHPPASSAPAPTRTTCPPWSTSSSCAASSSPPTRRTSPRSRRARCRRSSSSRPSSASSPGWTWPTPPCTTAPRPPPRRR